MPIIGTLCYNSTMKLHGELSVKNFSVSYFGYGNVVDGVEFTLPETGAMCVLGGEDSGKTTLLRGLAGLESTGGSVMIGDTDYAALHPKDKDVCYTFGQDSLNRRATVQDNVVYPLVIRGCDVEYIKNRLQYVSGLFGIGDLLTTKVKNLYPYHIAKVLLARAFIRECNLYLLDEPLSQLSYSEREKVFARMSVAVKSCNGRVIYATQRPYEAQMLPDKVMIMYGGTSLQCGTLSDIYSRPAHRAVCDMFRRDITYIPVKAVCKDGRWYIQTDKVLLPCAPLIDKIYDGAPVLAAVRESDVSEGGVLKGVVRDYCDDGKGRIMRVALSDGVVYCRGSKAIGEQVGINIADIGLLYDAESGRIISMPQGK